MWKNAVGVEVIYFGWLNPGQPVGCPGGSNLESLLGIFSYQMVTLFLSMVRLGMAFACIRPSKKKCPHNGVKHAHGSNHIFKFTFKKLTFLC